jgi:protein-S-isoprenylcysteine O-methyltransferase Ste14
MSRTFAVVGAFLFVASLLFFVLAFVWSFGKVSPWSWAAGWPPALLNTCLFTVFALHHSMFARTGFKARVMNLFPPALERSVYVWLASLLFFVVCALWRPVPGVLWSVSKPAAGILLAAQLTAAVFAVAAARRLDVLELAGIRQVRSRRNRPAHGVDDRGPYAWVRHPIYLGWFGMVWLTPTMNGTRLVFAVVSCVYLLLAIPFEERDLRRTFGDAYDRYAARVRWKVMPFVH